MIARSRTRRTDRTPDGRSAVATVELAVIIPVFLLLILGFLELSFAVFRYHLVSQGARHGARLAAVRGDLATGLGPWDPATLGNPHTVDADADDPVANAVEKYLTGLDLADTSISLSWPDGNNDLHSRVRVRVSTTHEPFLTLIFTSNWTLVAESTMTIAH